MDGNVGEQILEGAGARFVGSDALGNRSRTHHPGCVLLHPPASAVNTSAAHDRLLAERARAADRCAVEADLMALIRFHTRASATGGRRNEVASLARPRCAIVSWSVGPLVYRRHEQARAAVPQTGGAVKACAQPDRVNCESCRLTIRRAHTVRETQQHRLHLHSSGICK